MKITSQFQNYVAARPKRNISFLAKKNKSSISKERKGVFSPLSPSLAASWAKLVLPPH